MMLFSTRTELERVGSLGWTRIADGLGCRLLDGRAVVALLLLLISRLLLMMLPCKNKQEEGSARASPMAALMPKSVSF